MAEVRVAPSTALEQLLDEASSAPWVNLADLDSDELVEVLTSEDHGLSQQISDAGAEINSAAAKITRRMAHQGRLFYLNGNKPGRLGVLSPDIMLSPVELISSGDLLSSSTEGVVAPLNRPDSSGTNDDGTAGAADMLALELNPRDSIVVISAEAGRRYTQTALESAARSGAFTVEVSEHRPVGPAALHIKVGPATVPDAPAVPTTETAHKMLVNLLSTICGARLTQPGLLQNMMDDASPTGGTKR